MASAIVIGGGPAGSIAALLLARAGWQVDLFEQHTFPRDKVCGECLSGVGVDVLNRVGLSFDAESPALLTRSLLHPINGPTIELALPRPSLGISRLRMDVLLLDAAKRAGANVHQPARCELLDYTSAPDRVSPDINHRAGTPRLCWRDLKTNLQHKSTADWIILADGKGALLPRKTKTTGDLGIKTHFTHVNGPRDTIELFAGRGNYGGIAAVEDGKWNAAFSVPASRVRAHSGDLQSVFDQIVAENPMLRERLSTARRAGAWLAAPLPRFAVANDWPDRVIPIGNAAAALEPVGGEGMGLALCSAELAANALISGDGNSVRDLHRAFNKLWKMRRTVCRGIAMMFSSESVADAVAPLMAANLRIPAALLRLAGKAQL